MKCPIARFALIAGLALLPAAAWAHEPIKQPAKETGSSLDDELLKELTDGLGLDEPAPSKKPNSPEGESQPQEQPRDELDRSLLDELETDLVPDDEADPLSQIAQGMQRAGARIRQGDSGTATQKIQGDILSQLNQLLQQLKKRQKQQQQQGKGQQNQQAQRSKVPQPQNAKGQPGKQPMGEPGDERQPGVESTDRIEKGEVEPTEAEAVADLVRERWGHLPDKQREILIQAFKEKYLPQYQQMIKDYYSRLAREKNRR